MGHSKKRQNNEREIECKEKGDVLSVRLSSNMRRRMFYPIFAYFFLIIAVLPIAFLVKKDLHDFSTKWLWGFIVPILAGLFHLMLLWRNEWLRAEFVVNDKGIEKRLPSGKVFIGLWDNLIQVQLSRSRLCFRDGLRIKLVYGTFVYLSNDAWDMIIGKVPKDSILAVAWKDWGTFNDDTLFYKFGRIFSFISFSCSLGVIAYFEAYNPFDFVIPALLFFLFLVFCFMRDIVFRFREFRGIYTIKESNGR